MPTLAASSPIAHVLLISVDGLHASDLTRYVASKPQSALASLVRSGTTYTAALSPVPSDSYPGLLALVTGGTPRVTGIYFDEFYDRSLSPAGTVADCRQKGTTVRFDRMIDVDPTKVDGGGGIDPDKLPRDGNSDCRPVYPHEALRVNTVFEVIKAHGGRTAWSDKHLSYEIVNGPSGSGVDDLFTPEIFANHVSAKIDTTEAYDQTKVAAVLNEISGFDHTGVRKALVPALMGMNFQAVTTAQVTAGNGYRDGAGTPSPGLAGALDYVDGAIGSMLERLDRENLRASTAVIITAKHGQSPIDPKALRHLDNRVISDAIAGVGKHVLAHMNAGEGALIWLNDPAKTSAVVKALRAKSTSGGFDKIYSGAALQTLLASPLKDSRAPDILIQSKVGVLYLEGRRIAAHGGINHDDRAVALLISEPGMARASIATPVSTTQVAPTILALLGFRSSELRAVVREKTEALPTAKK